MKKEIAIILPYKEIYSDNFAGAASIWIKDYNKLSSLSSKTIIYGNLDKGKKPLSNNFKNLKITRTAFSKTKKYISLFYKDYLKYKTFPLRILVFLYSSSSYHVSKQQRSEYRSIEKRQIKNKFLRHHLFVSTLSITPKSKALFTGILHVV